MFNFIRSLFSSMDRQTAAADRAAGAMEDIASMLESARDQMKGRLGIESADPRAIAPVPVTPTEDAEKTAEPARKGRSRN